MSVPIRSSTGDKTTNMLQNNEVRILFVIAVFFVQKSYFILTSQDFKLDDLKSKFSVLKVIDFLRPDWLQPNQSIILI